MVAAAYIPHPYQPEVFAQLHHIDEAYRRLEEKTVSKEMLGEVRFVHQPVPYFPEDFPSFFVHTFGNNHALTEETPNQLKDPFSSVLAFTGPSGSWSCTSTLI